MPHADLVGAIDHLPAVPWTGSAFRHIAAGRSPLSGEGARLTGGRWNPKGSFAVVYLGLSPASVVGEFHRLARRQGVAPEDFLPRLLCTYEVALQRVLDLRTPEALEAVHLTDEQLRSDDLTACQAVGEAAQACGREAVLAPGATGLGDVLAVFVGHLLPASTLRDIKTELWESVPAI